MVGGTAIDSTTSQWLQIGVLWVAVFIIPFLGRLSDRVGRKPILWVGSIGTIVLAFPMILVLKSGSVPLVGLGLAVMGLLLILFSATCPSTLPALFPTEIRYGGLAISFNIFVSAFAGTTSLIMTAVVLGHRLGVLARGVPGLRRRWSAASVLLSLRETAGKPLPGSHPAVSTEQEARELVASQQLTSPDGGGRGCRARRSRAR